MFEFLIKLSGIVLPIFVFMTMFNVGLTQKLSDIVERCVVHIPSRAIA